METRCINIQEYRYIFIYEAMPRCAKLLSSCSQYSNKLSLLKCSFIAREKYKSLRVVVTKTL